MSEPLVIASLIVLARPDRLEEVEAGVTTINGAEIHARDPEGRLIVVLEATEDLLMTNAISRIEKLPGVLHVNLAFHHSDTARESRRATQELQA